MKNLAFWLLLLSSLNGLSQIGFEKGHIVNNADEKISCFIYNRDWMNNPSEIRYKISENGETITAGLKDLKAFSVSGIHYIRAQVKIDTSVQNLKKPNYNRYPEWNNKILFLRLLVEGNANLYSYHRNDELSKFFFSVNDSPIEQLVYKQFFRSATELDFNLMYLQQLKVQVSCNKLSDAALKSIAYSQSHLEKYFKKHNECMGSPVAITAPTRPKARIRFAITPGIDFQNFLVAYGSATIDYPEGKGFRIGVNIETVLPFNRNKWSVIAEPAFQSYTADKNVKHQSLELSAGPRHYFYVGDQKAIFLNALVVADIPVKYEAGWFGRKYTATGPSLGFAAGLGFTIQRFSIEARRYFERSVLADSVALHFVSDKYSMIIGYRFSK